MHRLSVKRLLLHFRGWPVKIGKSDILLLYLQNLVLFYCSLSLAPSLFPMVYICVYPCKQIFRSSYVPLSHTDTWISYLLLICPYEWLKQNFVTLFDHTPLLKVHWMDLKESFSPAPGLSHFFSKASAITILISKKMFNQRPIATSQISLKPY